MTRLSPDILNALKEANPVDTLLEQRGFKLGRVNTKGIRECACLCDPVKGKNPAWVNVNGNFWGCRKPGGCGGDVFNLLEKLDGLNFKNALEYLGGNDFVRDEEALKKASEERDKRRKEAEEKAALEREKDRKRAYELFMHGVPLQDTLVQDYFKKRGLKPFSSHALRFVASQPCWYDGVQIGAFPALLGAIQQADGKFSGVHITWLDVSQASGKAAIVALDGTPCPNKKMRGIAKGGAIRLASPSEGTATLILGEGIETTLSVYQALEQYGQNKPYAAWCGLSLNGLAALEPPKWAGKIILLGDGDSDPVNTRKHLDCAAQCWRDKGFEVDICFAPEGMDFNDMVRGAND